jgi:hypothetical protein
MSIAHAGALEAGPFATEAWRYFERAANILPIVPGTKKPPHGVNWRRWQDRPQTADEIVRLLETYPDADIAIVLGTPSGRLVDVETDSRAGEQALSDLRLPLPPTAMWRSPRGLHRLYRSAHPLPTRKTAPNLEMRAAGCYSIIPTSTGRRWLTPGDLDAVAPLPESWAEYILPTTPPLHSIERVLFLSLDTAFLDTPADLGELFTSAPVVAAAATTLGIPVLAVGKAFTCVLPGHVERHPSATLCRNSRGAVVYHDWHRRGGPEYLTLPEVRASLAYGRGVKLPGPSLATWGLRLLVEAKVLRPAAVECLIPLVPPSVGAVGRSLRDGFALLLGCKWLHSFGEPTPFTPEFAAAWCGLSEYQARQGIRAAIQLGIIRRVGVHKRAALFLPGGGS